MQSKKGLQFSINFIVGLILAIVLFGFGLYFANQLMGTSQELVDQDMDQYEKSIKHLACAGGDKVCMPVSRQTLKSGKPAFFGLALENVFKDTPERNFRVSVLPGMFVPQGKTASQPLDASLPGTINYLPDSQGKEVAVKAHDTAQVGLVVQLDGVDAGTYSFAAKVEHQGSDGWAEYSSPLRFYVTTR
jgi:hypothetical protein